jgi:hypothetical protein
MPFGESGAGGERAKRVCTTGNDKSSGLTIVIYSKIFEGPKVK